MKDLGNEKSKKISENYLIKACDLNEESACYTLGTLYMQDTSREKSFPQIFKLFEKACNGLNAEGCRRLARFYEKGIGVKQNPEKAQEILMKICTFEDHEYCHAESLLNEKP